MRRVFAVSLICLFFAACSAGAGFNASIADLEKQAIRDAKVAAEDVGIAPELYKGLWNPATDKNERLRLASKLIAEAKAKGMDDQSVAHVELALSSMLSYRYRASQ